MTQAEKEELLDEEVDMRLDYIYTREDDMGEVFTRLYIEEEAFRNKYGENSEEFSNFLKMKDEILASVKHNPQMTDFYLSVGWMSTHFCNWYNEEAKGEEINEQLIHNYECFHLGIPIYKKEFDGDIVYQYDSLSRSGKERAFLDAIDWWRDEHEMMEVPKSEIDDIENLLKLAHEEKLSYWYFDDGSFADFVTIDEMK